jgi:hypothetical protein
MIFQQLFGRCYVILKEKITQPLLYIYIYIYIYKEGFPVG